MGGKSAYESIHWKKFFGGILPQTGRNSYGALVDILQLEMSEGFFSMEHLHK